MKVIKPQTLLFQYAPTQFGRRARMGISAGIGFRLSDPRILVHEANVWAAVKAAPTSAPLCEMSLPKKQAEWLLLGHSTAVADSNQMIGESCEWTANVKLGDTSKTVNCKSNVQADGVARLSVDHASAAAQAKHIGVIENRDAPLMLMGRLGVGADSSAAMTPLDQRWPERQKWMPRFEATPEAMASDGTHMGWPEKTDFRLFQQAHENQWSRDQAWPQDLSYALHGFGENKSILEGVIPKVKPQLLVCKKSTNGFLYETPDLTLQTIWLLPDSDVGVLWWHGEASIDYVLDNSIFYSVCSVAMAGEYIDQSRLRSIAEIRMDFGKDDYLNDSDFTLMPKLSEAPVWELILSGKDHPNGLPITKKYDQVFDELTKSWRELVQLDKNLKEQAKTQEKDKKFISKDYSPIRSDKSNYALSKAGIQGPSWRDYLTTDKPDESRSLSDAIIQDQDLSGLIIRDWNMADVRFERCKLHGTKFLNVNFKNVDFEGCEFDKSGFIDSTWIRGQITDTKINSLQWRQVESTSLLVSKVESVDWRFILCSLSDMLFDSGTHVGMIQDDCDINSITFLKLKCTDSYWKKSKISDAGFVASDVSGLLVVESIVDKLSAVDACFDRMNSSKSKFNSFVLSKKSSINDAEFIECVIENGCWLGIAARNLLVRNCSMRQLNLEGVIADNSKWHYSLLSDAHLKDASLVDTSWNYVALCGANLCGVDFTDARVKSCNLRGANLAWSLLPNMKSFRADNIVSEINYFPIRS